jgi:hypothetical protein
MQFLLAVMAAAAATVMTPPETGKTGFARQIEAISMPWRIHRETGSAPGQKSCFVISRGGDVIARLFKDPQARTSTWSVRVGLDGQHGSLRYLRINKKFFQTDQQSFRGTEADEIVKLLKSPGELVFEWAQRPDHSKRGGLFGTGDFAAKAAQCERWLNGTRAGRPRLRHSSGAPRKELIFLPFTNYAARNHDIIREMMLDEQTLFGLGDGGAHCGLICDASIPTYLLTHWVRDRARGDRLPLEWIVKRQTKENADFFGLHDRGVLAPGMKADINVIDFDGLRLRPPHIVNDLPAGGRRLVQEAQGYIATIQTGAVTFENGIHCGALPGGLIRGRQAGPKPA